MALRLRLQQVVLRAATFAADRQPRWADAVAGDVDRVGAGAQVRLELARVARVERAGLTLEAGLAVVDLEVQLLRRAGLVGHDQRDGAGAEALGGDRDR